MQGFVSARSRAIKQRILTAAIILPLLSAFIIYAGPLLFGVVLGLISLLALHEFYRMALPARRRFESGCGLIAAAVMTAALLCPPAAGAPLAWLALPALVLLLVFLFRLQEIALIGQEMALTLFGLVYVPLLLVHAGLLRALPFGREWIFLVLAIVMVSDSMAYFIGRRWGRRKLYPSVSPNKSVEGALGGLLGGLLGAALCKLTFFAALAWPDALLLGAAVGVFSQVGDLVESLLKRSFGVKDSGTLIPGHGGMLDRLDSLLFAFPATYYYVVWMVLS
ncbi:MAG: phosphatidate cytidylyltransferase [Desulfuromonadales bacterium]|nr:phosphatidate cytidylyltransferase [Desulfuromonadales bacterium]